jgi:hypothetical protein
MAVSFDPTNPRLLTHEQRLDELTAILAIGMGRVMELRADRCCIPTNQNPLESQQNSLDVPWESRLHGSRG